MPLAATNGGDMPKAKPMVTSYGSNHLTQQILIESDKKRIKREIGQVFLDLLQFTMYK